MPLLTSFKVVWIVLFLQPIALGFIKLSALFFYRRIFIGKTFNILSWVLIGITSGWMVAFFFGLFFDCEPSTRSLNNALSASYQRSYIQSSMQYSTFLSCSSQFHGYVLFGISSWVHAHDLSGLLHTNVDAEEIICRCVFNAWRLVST